MNNAAAISAVNRALANYRRRQAHAHAPTDHSAREIVQISMLAEYLHETHVTEISQRAEPQDAARFAPSTIAAAA
jgi:hypothetical protein